MIKYDESSLNVELRGKLPLYDGLEEFAMKVSMLKPMVNFVVDATSCTKHMWVKDSDGIEQSVQFITGLLVYENGEQLGAISTDIRHRGHEKDLVYEVESFRISKSRGSQNVTASKDMKVAIRLAKKTLVARADNEAKSLIRKQLAEGIHHCFNNYANNLRWSFEVTDEAFIYATLAYQARLVGETTVKLPSKLKSVKATKEHDERCGLYEDARHIKDMFADNKGYGVQVLSDGKLNVFDFFNDTLRRYDGFDSLPDAVQSKYAVFKVLKDYEIVTTIGVKLNDEFAYVVE
jgi:hypothetical protein